MSIESRRRSGFALLASLVTASRADAFASYPVRDARVTIAGYKFGLVDMNPGWNSIRDNGLPRFTLLEAGPAGTFNVPFDIGTATYALRKAALSALRP